MVTLCWAAKGGSGTTVVASALAIADGSPTLLVDLDGEIPSVLGLPDSDRPGLAEWLASDAPATHLDDLLIDVDDRVTLLPWRSNAPLHALAQAPATTVPAFAAADEARRRWFIDWLTDRSVSPDRIIIDAGTGEPSADLAEMADRRLLVTRPCYLALRRAMRTQARPTGVALVGEPGRSLTKRDVEYSLGVPVVASVSLDPAVARAVDAGLLTVRLPGPIRRELRGAAL